MTARDATDEPAGDDRDELPADVQPDELATDGLASDEVPSGEVPSDDVQSDDIPSDDIPSDETPSDELPSHDARSDAAPSDAVVPDVFDPLAGSGSVVTDPAPAAALDDDPDDALVPAEHADAADDALDPAPVDPAPVDPATVEPATVEPDAVEPDAVEESSTDDDLLVAHSDDELARPLYDPLPPSDDEPPIGEPVFDETASGRPQGEASARDEVDAREGGAREADAPEGDAAAATGEDHEERTTEADASAQPPVPDSVAALAEAPAGSGWAVLGRAMAPRATRAQVAAGVLCALLGFAVVVQVRQNDETALSGLRQSELVRVLDETTERGDQLRREVSELRGERDRLASGSDGQAAAIDSLRRSAITQGILSGRLPAEGPGVRVTLLDPGRDLQPVTMLNMLEELRNAGAEAIQLNDQRVTASSSFTGTRGDVLLDGVRLEPPYEWLAIGDPSTLSIALQIPGGAMATVRGTGATGTVEEQDEVSVSAVRTLPDPAYASPVPLEAG